MKGTGHTEKELAEIDLVRPLLSDFLSIWNEFLRTGRLDVSYFNDQFTALLKTGVVPDFIRLDEFRQFLQSWGEIAEYPEISGGLYQSLPLEVAEEFLRRLTGAVKRQEADSAVSPESEIGEVLFFLKNPLWLQRVSAAGRHNTWFDLFLGLIQAGNFHVGNFFQTWSKHYQDEVVFKCSRNGQLHHMNWEELQDRILRTGKSMQKFFQESGTKPHVAIISRNRPEMVVVDLAALCFGYVNIMVPDNATPDDMAFMIDDSEASLLFLTDEHQLQVLLPHLPGIEQLKKIVLFDGPSETYDRKVVSYKRFVQSAQLSGKDLEQEFPGDIRITDLATIMYTSGTTGKPKGIMFSHLNIISKRFARALAWPMVGENDVFLCYLPLYHTFGRWLEMMGSLFWGATYVFVQSPSINNLIREMQIHRPTVFISIPQKWQQIYQYIAQQIDLERAPLEQIKNMLDYCTGGALRLGLSAAGYLEPEIFKFFQQNGVDLMSGFGMTEATGGITMTLPGKYKENSLGAVLPGIELGLAADGELIMRGPYVMIGYWKAPGEESFDSEGWFHSGDLMKKDVDDYYYIIDRKKEIYKNLKGQTIAPQRIEKLFRDIEAVKRVFLVGDQREYNTLLIYPNYQYQDVNLRDMSPVELNEFMQSLVVSVNRFLAPYERIVQFRVIDRDFSQELDELTPKKTYRRKVIEKNFRAEINRMYQAKFVRMRFKQFQLLFPKWLVRELGILANDIKIDRQQRLNIQNKPVMELETDAADNRVLRIGNLWYRVREGLINLGEILTDPSLWLTNQPLVELSREKVFGWNRHVESGGEISLVVRQPKSTLPPEAAWKVFRIIQKTHKYRLTLRGLHFCGLLIQLGNREEALQAIAYLTESMQIPDYSLHNYTRQLLRLAVLNPDSEVKRQAFLNLKQMVPEEEWIALLQYFLEWDSMFLDKFLSDKLCEIHIHDSAFDRFLAFAESFTRNALAAGATELPTQVENLFQFLQHYVLFHPIKYPNVRQFFTLFSVETDVPALAQLAKNSLQRIEESFRNWLGGNAHIAVDPDLGQEYTWKQVVVFDDNVPENHTYVLLKLINETPFIREALFLFTGSVIVNLKDLPPGGIWITLMSRHHGKSVYRISVQTRYQGRHDILANINQSMPKAELEAEIAWSIICGERANLPKIVEKFGGYWPQYQSWSEDYLPGETVLQYYKRLARQGGEIQIERLKNLWPYIIWSACKACVDFWNRTGKRFEISEPLPDNLVVPHHDYHTGSRIVSISSRRPFENLGTLLINFYEKFVKAMEEEFPFLKDREKWQFIFSPVVEILGEDTGLAELKKLPDDIAQSCYKRELTQSVNFYLQGVKARGFIPKRMYFAIQRYKRWKSLNTEATAQAEASTLYELYRTYQLQELEENYPETRIRFYQETVFKKARAELQKQFDRLIQLLRRKKFSQDETVRFTTDLQSRLILDDRDKYLITRMGYTHLRPSDEAELVARETGEKSETTLVVTFLDREGEQIQVRDPLNPREVARLHRLFHKFNLPVSFQPQDQFLLAFNEREQLVGGLFYYRHDKETVHLEKIVVADHYRRKGVSGGILNEFFNRMKALNYLRVKTGFFRPEFFYRFGFRIEKGYAGLVKNLVEES